MELYTHDYVLRAVAENGLIRAFAASTRDMAEEARRRHQTSPVCTAALGRLLTAAGMMSVQMKGEEDKLTLKIKGDGPAGGLLVMADSRGNCKGFVENPEVLLHANAKGKLDVGGAVGKGTLTVTKDLGLKEPYVGTCELQNGEIAEDLTYYFLLSEQTPSAVALGVLMSRDNTVRQAGGYILQLLPGAGEETAALLEERVASLPPVTAMLDEGLTPEQILEKLLGDRGLEIMEKQPVRFQCDCSREKVSAAVASIGRYELLDLMLAQKTVEAHCDFCNTYYEFERGELKELFKKYYRSGAPKDSAGKAEGEDSPAENTEGEN